MLNSRRTHAVSLSAIFEAPSRRPFSDPRISLRDGETREASDPENTQHSTVPNRLLKKLQDVYVREVDAHRDPRASEELRELLECPIDLGLMRQPVVDPYGHHFNAAHLKHWIDRGNRKAPVPGQSRHYRGASVSVVVDRRVVRLLLALNLPTELEAIAPSPWPLPGTLHAPELTELDRHAPQAAGADSRAALTEAAECALGTTVGSLTLLSCGISGLLAAPLMGLVIGSSTGGFRALRAWAEQEFHRCAEALQDVVAPMGL